MPGNLVIAVDFDGTIVEHKYPDIGKPVPGAIEWMKSFQAAGAKLILWTMRSHGREDGSNPLQEAIDYCANNGVEFWGVNSNPDQHTWTQSPKAYANVYIDDAALGCPLAMTLGPKDAKPSVDWSIVGPAVMKLLENANAR